MIASTEWKPETGAEQGTLYDGHTQSGHTIRFDSTPAHTTGLSPMEAVLTALCGCTSVDVVSILQKKREPITGLTVSATAEQSPAPPRVFTKIHLTYRIRGNVTQKAAEDAVSLSKNKYCSVSKMLEKAADITYSIELDEGAASA
ncbi:OsmC family protein [Paracidobacterium acidisoli]|uniref:OsmC family peroxiredoxin n=1 Tax=Paracidobacterium acidisoli TaxID=2303751 RepID=A0A372IKQ9_9BACT|nr:OsmC family protein [Paracidobacterium acidisoli]MBT9332854.1 OsmC family protein [Paracidobacterium acidisoli]